MLLFTLAALAADPVEDLPESETPPPAPAPSAEAPAPAAPPAPAGPHPVTQAELQTAVNAAYGKPVPTPAVCSEKAEIPGISKEIVVFGVTQKNVGCKLFGVMVDGQSVPLADGVATAAGEAWAKLDSKARNDLALAWTRDVLLAFDFVAPTATPTVKPGVKGAFVVAYPFVAHTSEAHVSQEVDGQFTYDAAGKLTLAKRDTGPKYRTDLYQTKYSVTGVSEGVIAAGIQSVGGAIDQCFEARYAADPTISGATRFAWTLGSDGKIGKLGAEESADPELTRCYGNALYEAKWPSGTKGAAVWSFSVVRTAL